MAKRIVWTDRAQAERKAILRYWIKRDGSNTYSIKLNALFKYSVKIISEFPQIGKPTNDGLARVKIVKDYMIIYQESMVYGFMVYEFMSLWVYGFMGVAFRGSLSLRSFFHITQLFSYLPCLNR